MVEKAQTDSKHHVDDTKDNGHLHLKGVEEGQFISSDVPNLSQPKETKGYLQRVLKWENSHPFKK